MASEGDPLEQKTKFYQQTMEVFISNTTLTTLHGNKSTIEHNIINQYIKDFLSSKLLMNVK